MPPSGANGTLPSLLAKPTLLADNLSGETCPNPAEDALRPSLQSEQFSLLQYD